ncbi:MAG: tRNA (adenosine(37)-N6)-dimethylallyltransferase MiaA [Phycisphaeraceae bacterium]|nr:tRNA (adenosine(37)-N6)-dimethylallyltransferase MiaA [Phycisphaeraceae bacterium]
MPAPRPIILLGPTAAGKSELAVRLAQRLHPGASLILSADSMQLYRRMDAGTAKPSPRLRSLVPHHLIDLVEPNEPFTVADWLSRADALITDAQAHDQLPIVVGGTNLYLQALLEGLFDGPPRDASLRAELDALSNADLHARLAAADPAAAERIHPNDRKKAIRALEVFLTTGSPISSQQQQWTTVPASETTYRHDPILLGLAWPTELLNHRINLRVKAMFFPEKAREQDGLSDDDLWPGRSLQDETRDLESAGLLGTQARQALGYKQVLDHLAGRCTLEEAYEQTKIQTRQFAKRQRTWLKRFRGVHWLDPRPLIAGRPDDLLDQIVLLPPFLDKTV